MWRTIGHNGQRVLEPREVDDHAQQRGHGHTPADDELGDETRKRGSLPAAEGEVCAQLRARRGRLGVAAGGRLGLLHHVVCVEVSTLRVRGDHSAREPIISGECWISTSSRSAGEWECAGTRLRG